MSEIRASLTPISGNKKTGPMPVSTSDRSSCPSTCAFKKAGCFGEQGPIWMWWRAVDANAKKTWASFLEAVRQIPRWQLWRHNQVGDLPHNDDWIDLDKLRDLVKANFGRRGFTYTHHRVLGSTELAQHNRAIVAEANRGGFTINVSTETRRDADRLVDLGLPVALAVPEKTRRRTKTQAGRPVLVCPATYTKAVNCGRCGWCAKPDRKFIVAFPAHGSGKRLAEAAIKRAQKRRGIR